MSAFYRIDYYKPAEDPKYETYASGPDDATRAELYVNSRFMSLHFEMPAQRYALSAAVSLLNEAHDRGRVSLREDLRKVLGV